MKGLWLPKAWADGHSIKRWNESYVVIYLFIYFHFQNLIYYTVVINLYVVHMNKTVNTGGNTS